MTSNQGYCLLSANFNHRDRALEKINVLCDVWFSCIIYFLIRVAWNVNFKVACRRLQLRSWCCFISLGAGVLFNDCYLWEFMWPLLSQERMTIIGYIIDLIFFTAKNVVGVSSWLWSPFLYYSAFIVLWTISLRLALKVNFALQLYFLKTMCSKLMPFHSDQLTLGNTLRQILVLMLFF